MDRTTTVLEPEALKDELLTTTTTEVEEEDPDINPEDPQLTRELIDEFFGTEEEAGEEAEEATSTEDATTVEETFSKGGIRCDRRRQSNLHSTQRRQGKRTRAKMAISYLRGIEDKDLSPECKELLQRASELNVTLGEFKKLPRDEQRELSRLAGMFIDRANGIKGKQKKPRKASPRS